MSLVQLIVAALSLAAAGGGAVGLDKVLDNFCRTPACEQEAAAERDEERDRMRDQRISY